MIAVEHDTRWMSLFSLAISSALIVSRLLGENDIAQPTGFWADRSSTTARYAQPFPAHI